MTLKQWQTNGWLKIEPTSRAEIANMLAMIDRDIHDAAGAISPDWRFGIAYNAALKLCTILVRAEGYRPGHTLHHYRAIMAMPLILGQGKKADAHYLDSCRTKRNIVEYDYVGGASNADADELIEFATELKPEVLKWLKETTRNCFNMELAEVLGKQEVDLSITGAQQGEYIRQDHSVRAEPDPPRPSAPLPIPGGDDENIRLHTKRVTT